MASTQHELVRCDLTFPPLVEELKALKKKDPKQVEAVFEAVAKIKRITWQQVFATASKGKNKRGVNWVQNFTHREPPDFTDGSHLISR